MIIMMTTLITLTTAGTIEINPIENNQGNF